MGLLINGQPVAATEFAWEGCHKVYLIFTPEDRARMVELGYGQDDDGSEILPVSELPRVWDETCSLRFISSADLETQFVEQCENGTVSYVESDDAPYRARRLQFETGAGSDLLNFTGWHQTELVPSYENAQAHNDACATFGGRALAVSVEHFGGGDDLEGTLGDLLAALRHFADAAGVDYTEADRRAANWYDDEINGVD